MPIIQPAQRQMKHKNSTNTQKQNMKQNKNNMAGKKQYKEF
jgi:hypothetical protein